MTTSEATPNAESNSERSTSAEPPGGDHDNAPSAPAVPAPTASPSPESDLAAVTAPNDLLVTEPEPPQDGQRPSKVPDLKDVRSVEALLHYAYARVGRFSISPTIRDALVADEPSMEDLKRVAEELASGDPLLKVPVRILAAVDRAGGSMKFRRRCTSAVAQTFLANGALRSVHGLEAALAHHEFGNPEQLLNAVAERIRTVMVDLKPQDRRTLHANATTGLALHFAIQREWNEAKLSKVLDAALWEDGYQSVRESKRESLRALLVETSPAALGTVARAWQGELEEERSRVTAAQRLQQIAEDERDGAVKSQIETEREVEQLRTELSEEQGEVERLLAELAREVQVRRVQSSHAVDDYENLRTRMIRSIDRQLLLLEDGLHAVRSGSTAVTEEYLERVIESFVKEADRLRDQNKSGQGGGA